MPLYGMRSVEVSLKPRAMILAAGRGERLRPLTDHTPKPLLFVGARRLIEWHLLALARAGVSEVVINTAWLEDQFPAVLGGGERYGVRIHWSFELQRHGGALETAGGIREALPALGETFWVVAADVFIPEFRFDEEVWSHFRDGNQLARLWMVPNPPHHPAGDFALSGAGAPPADTAERLTWASVGLFRAEMFGSIASGAVRPLRPLLDAAQRAGRLATHPLPGRWIDVGTVERLRLARAWASAGLS